MTSQNFDMIPCECHKNAFFEKKHFTAELVTFWSNFLTHGHASSKKNIFWGISS
jgi:hypothetical protein